jgi:hypothetical protein
VKIKIKITTGRAKNDPEKAVLPALIFSKVDVKDLLTIVYFTLGLWDAFIRLHIIIASKKYMEQRHNDHP